jgi:hypothetical protein
MQAAPTGTAKYGGAHKQLRKRLLAALQRDPGQPCPRCGYPMWPGQRLHLDHSDDGVGWLGLSHARCNERAGQRKTSAINRARNAYRRRGAQTAPWPSARQW